MNPRTRRDERWIQEFWPLSLCSPLVILSPWTACLSLIQNALVEDWKPCWYSHSKPVETKDFRSFLQNVLCAATWAYVQLACWERTFSRNSETLITFLWVEEVSKTEGGGPDLGCVLHSAVQVSSYTQVGFSHHSQHAIASGELVLLAVIYNQGKQGGI